MKRSASRLLADPRVGALLALLIAGVVLPASARASCSAHYITSRTQAAGATIDVELLKSSGALPGTDGRRPAPCSGAFCSGNRAPLPSPAPSLSTEIGEEWAISSSPVMPATPGSSPCPPGDPIRRPDERSRAIFHPPPATSPRAIS